MTSHVTDQPIVAEGETHPEPSAEFKAQQEVTESTEDDAAPATPVQDPNPETQPVESTPGPEGDNQSQDMEMD